MNKHPRTGDRVRLTTRDFEPDYRPGDTGTVESGPHPIPSGGFFYLVTVEKDGPGAAAIVFNASEIEVEAVASRQAV
jgi:hypothetical protein